MALTGFKFFSLTRKTILAVNFLDSKRAVFLNLCVARIRKKLKL